MISKHKKCEVITIKLRKSVNQACFLSPEERESPRKIKMKAGSRRNHRIGNARATWENTSFLRLCTKFLSHAAQLLLSLLPPKARPWRCGLFTFSSSCCRLLSGNSSCTQPSSSTCTNRRLSVSCWNRSNRRHTPCRVDTVPRYCVNSAGNRRERKGGRTPCLTKPSTTPHQQRCPAFSRDKSPSCASSWQHLVADGPRLATRWATDPLGTSGYSLRSEEGRFRDDGTSLQLLFNQQQLTAALEAQLWAVSTM